jgi:hypothetical protein
MPIMFILKYANDMNLDWDVALYSGAGEDYLVGHNITISKETRQIFDKGTYYEVLNRQVSSGSSESIVFDAEKAKAFGSNRKDIRQNMERPLLMLHILENKKDDPRGNNNSFAAFGVSFPGGINSGNQTVRLKINTVYLDNLQEQMEGEESDD